MPSSTKKKNKEKERWHQITAAILQKEIEGAVLIKMMMSIESLPLIQV